jgi:hypothetical protein
LEAVGERAQDPSLPSHGSEPDGLELSATLSEEGLDWASLGSWTDVSIRSHPEMLERTINALQQAVESEQDEQHRAQRGTRNQVILLSVALVASAGLFAGFLASGMSPHLKSVIGSLLGIAIGTFGFSSGSVIGLSLIKRKTKREGKIFQTTLLHELEYIQRIRAQGD